LTPLELRDGGGEVLDFGFEAGHLCLVFASHVLHLARVLRGAALQPGPPLALLLLPAVLLLALSLTRRLAQGGHEAVVVLQHLRSSPCLCFGPLGRVGQRAGVGLVQPASQLDHLLLVAQQAVAGNRVRRRQLF
jgi:hypothetical protein